jgi:hypothetical protein
VPDSGKPRTVITTRLVDGADPGDLGPCFGYVLEGEVVFELEGEPTRVIRAGEAFWEPGGDVIHYQDGNNREMICVTAMSRPSFWAPSFSRNRELSGLAVTRTSEFWTSWSLNLSAPIHKSVVARP